MPDIYGVIYKITDPVGKSYIGKRKGTGLDVGKTYLGSGRYITRAIKKYGKESFKFWVFENCYSKDQLNEREKFWIKFFNSLFPNGYNLTKGGDGGWEYAQSIACKLPRTKKQLEASSRSGKIVGNTPKRPKTKVQLESAKRSAQIMNSLPATAKKREASRKTAYKMGKLPRTEVQLKACGKNFSKIRPGYGPHVAWHVNRNIVSSNCKYCKGEENGK